MKKSTTPTFLLELPLVVTVGQAKRLRAHFEAARCLYNALLGEAFGTPSSTQFHLYWESAELRLRAALERLHQRAKEGQVLPRSVGIPRAGARLPKSHVQLQQELVYRRGRLEALG